MQSVRKSNSSNSNNEQSAGCLKGTKPPLFNIDEFLAKKANKRKKKIKTGTYADENDSLSDFVPSPDREIEDDYTYLNNLNKVSKERSKVPIAGKYKGHYSELNKQMDMNFFALKNYANKKGEVVEEYIKPKEPEYFKD